jgi:hypothetical protein
MKRFFTSAVVLGLGLAVVLTATDEAAAKSGKGSPSSYSKGPVGVSYANSHANSHANSYANSYARSNHYPRTSYALNRSFRNWSSWCWNSRFRCYTYCYGPSRCYYYWYAPACCYYPISYIDDYPPTACQYQTASPGVAPLPVQVQVTNINQNGQNALNGVPAVIPGPSGPIPGPGK